MLPPTPTNVRDIVESLQSRGDMYQAELADLIGVNVSSLKRNMATGSSHRPISIPTWQLLLLLADRHPYFTLSERLSKK
jgi:hypothetical protein